MYRVLVPCGNESAYRRHRRRGETPCPRCKEAHALHQKMYREWVKERSEQEDDSL